MQISSILSLDRGLSGATTPSQSGPGSDGNEEVVHIPQSSSNECPEYDTKEFDGKAPVMQKFLIFPFKFFVSLILFLFFLRVIVFSFWKRVIVFFFFVSVLFHWFLNKWISFILVLNSSHFKIWLVIDNDLSLNGIHN